MLAVKLQAQGEYVEFILLSVLGKIPIMSVLYKYTFDATRSKHRHYFFLPPSDFQFNLQHIHRTFALLWPAETDFIAPVNL